jgi:hypothetical protein
MQMASERVREEGALCGVSLCVCVCVCVCMCVCVCVCVREIVCVYINLGVTN